MTIEQRTQLESIETGHWLLIDTPEDTFKISVGQLSSFIGAVKKVNNVSPTEGNVNLTADNISDTSTVKKFVTQEEKDKISKIITNGSAANFLTADGSYRTIPGGAAVFGSITGNPEDQENLSLYIGEQITSAINAIPARLWGDLGGNIEDQSDLINYIKSFAHTKSYAQLKTAIA